MTDLNKEIQYVKGVGPARAKSLNKLGIYTLGDLITYYPRDYEDRSIIKKIDEVKDGDKVAVPNDSTNEARALKLLAKQGLIEVKDGELITVKDITKNPKNLKFVEVDAAQVPSTLDDVAIAVINTNYALNVGLNPTKDALAIESSDSPYVNIVAIRTEEKDSDKIKALTKALNSDEVKKFIEEKYNGSIVPAF